jgi:hypothetical protein
VPPSQILEGIEAKPYLSRDLGLFTIKLLPAFSDPPTALQDHTVHYAFTRDEFELEFSGSSEPEL